MPEPKVRPPGAERSTGEGGPHATHRLGRLDLAIVGDDPVLPGVLEELRPLAIAGGGGGAQLVLRAGAAPEVPDGVEVDGIVAAADAVHAAHNRLRYTFRRGAGPARIDLRSELTTWKHRVVPPSLARLQDRAYLDPTENASKNLLYNLFDWATQVVGAEVGQSWLHASGVSDGERGVALAAWGGVGKTSTMLDMVRHHGWRYLSDDLVLLTDDGVLHRSPKHLQVYSYNAEGDEELRTRLLAGRPAVDRGAWAVRDRLLGPAKVRRRVSAEELFGPASVATAAPLSHAYLLRRVRGRPLAIEATTPAWFAMRAATTLVAELRPFAHLSTAIHSATDRTPLPTVEELVDRARSTIAEALGHAQVHVVDIPAGTDPRTTSAALRAHLAGRQP